MTLALIAGAGRLPVVLAEGLRRTGRDHAVWSLAGSGSDLEGATVFPPERLGNALKDMARAGVTEVCFAGAVTRPEINPARLSASTLPLAPRIVAALGKGDDALLRAVAAIFEERGIALVGAHEVLPELLPPTGMATRATPGKRDRADALRAEAIHAALSVADVGQACVVAAGQALALEALPGTDAMLSALASQRGKRDMPSGGVLYKAPKTGQDRRLDLPAVGPETVVRAAAAGLSGLVLEAGGVMVIDRDEAVREAESAGLWIWIRPMTPA